MNKRIRKKKGLSKIKNEELWDLDDTLAKYILPRLIKYKTINKNSHPIAFDNIEDWHNTIDKMIWSFEKIVKDNWVYKQLEAEKERFEEGMNLFAKHFMDLWD